jgi:hypothetical protein
MAQGVETWLDKLCSVWGTVSDGENGTVRSFLVFERNEMPNSFITAIEGACAASYVESLQPEYSAGGPTLFFWSGLTEFHLTADVKPANAGMVMLYFSRIVAAAAGNMKLSNTVEHFFIPPVENAVQMVTFNHPVTGQPDHQGILVRWQVKQNVSGSYTVSG